MDFEKWRDEQDSGDEEPVPKQEVRSTHQCMALVNIPDLLCNLQTYTHTVIGYSTSSNDPFLHYL